MSERINLNVEDGIGALMSDLAGGERKRGQWLSDLVRAMHETHQQAYVSDIEQVKLAFSGLLGQQKQLEGRVIQLERQVSALMASGTD
jgi:hypothetical protein